MALLKRQKENIYVKLQLSGTSVPGNWEEDNRLIKIAS